MLPEGYSECDWCSTPTSGGGLCPSCCRVVDRAAATLNMIVVDEGWDKRFGPKVKLDRGPNFNPRYVWRTPWRLTMAAEKQEQLRV